MTQITTELRVEQIAPDAAAKRKSHSDSKFQS
jgi:hypothetical protein